MKPPADFRFVCSRCISEFTLAEMRDRGGELIWVEIKYPGGSMYATQGECPHCKLVISSSLPAWMFQEAPAP
jgi:hypothetical protein